eukprot:6182979-Pleurochrysis_carterae.AAC.3
MACCCCLAARKRVAHCEARNPATTNNGRASTTIKDPRLVGGKGLHSKLNSIARAKVSSQPLHVFWQDCRMVENSTVFARAT